MSRSSLRRLATVTAVAAVAAVAVPSPALAGEMYFSKTSSRIVSTSWVEIGTLPGGVAGNAHVGDMQVEDLGRGRTRIQGIVFDLQCDEGEVPAFPGDPHGEPSPEPGCEELGVRFIEGGQVTLTIDRKLTRARLTGSLVVGHGGTAVTPPVNISWTGVGSVFTDRQSGTTVDEYGTSRYSYTFTGRRAVVGAGSNIGAMIFDNVPGESSQALMGDQRSSNRSRL